MLKNCQLQMLVLIIKDQKKPTRKIKCPQQFVPSIKDAEGKWVFNSKKKALAFSTYLGNILKPFPTDVYL